MSSESVNNNSNLQELNKFEDYTSHSYETSDLNDDKQDQGNNFTINLLCKCMYI